MGQRLQFGFGGLGIHPRDQQPLADALVEQADGGVQTRVTAGQRDDALDVAEIARLFWQAGHEGDEAREVKADDGDGDPLQQRRGSFFPRLD